MEKNTENSIRTGVPWIHTAVATEDARGAWATGCISSNFAMISPWTNCSTDEEYQKMVRLKADVRKFGFGFAEFLCRWKAKDQKLDIRFLLIPKIGKESALQIGAIYKQESIIWQDETGFAELCSVPFEAFSRGEIIRKNEVTKDQITIDQIKAILGKWLKNAPSSEVVAELYAVEQPRPSYFQTKERIYKVFDF